MSSRRVRRGQAIVLVALGMAVFLGFLGLVLDGGSSYLEQRGLQRSADLAALSGAWAYYHHNYEEQAGPGFPASVASGQAAAMTAIDSTLLANAYPADAQPRQVTFTDASGTGLLTPGAADVRGVKVHLSRVLTNQLLGALGVGNPNIVADATAVMGPPSGSQNEAPLLLQGYTDATHNLPRGTGYPACPTSSPDGTRLAVTASTDCRPSTGGAWPQPLNVEPFWNTGPPALGGAFTSAPVTRFYLLHEPANQVNPAQPLPPALVTSGLPEFLPTCSLPNPCPDTFYADTTRALAGDPVKPGMQQRISNANAGKWVSQSCAAPRDSVNPLTTDNPRLVRLPVTYAAGPAATSNPNVGGFKVSETIDFCVDTVYVDAGQGTSYSVSGYLVEEPTADPALVSKTDPYFGRDVAVRLIS